MGISSFMSYDCTFPKGTKINESSELFASRHSHKCMKMKEGLWHVHDEGEGYHSDDYLDDLIDLLCGVRLDKVPGLELDANYQCWEDGEWEHTISIKDGKVKCHETETRWIDSDLDRIEANIGQPLVSVAKNAWESLEDVPVDDEDCITRRTFIRGIFRWYDKGTSKFDIWHDIESETRVSVAYLMGQAKNPDGSNE